jgi:solute carrier family 25 (mitochondrial iron transporter), member 28/37
METVTMEFEELPQGTPFLASLGAGALAGIAEHTLIFPLDSLKTRLQVFVVDPAARYSSSSDALRRIYTTEGVMRLWRGVISMVAGAGPAHAVYFATYEQCKRLLGIGEEGKAGTAAPWRSSIAGAAATTAADAFMNPFDVVKQRMQMHLSPYSGIFDCFKKLYLQEGFRAFYRSYPTTLLLNIPFHSIQFPVYERLRSKFGKHSSLAHIFAGGIAGGIAGFLTTPIDVIKTTLQTTPIGHASQISGMASAADAVFKEYGLSGFFRGALPRTLTFIPSTAICWACYEYCRLLFI